MGTYRKIEGPVALKSALVDPKGDKPPIFIVGCGHSGTSLLLAVLGVHSRIYAVPYESKIGLKSDEEARRLFADFYSATVAAGKTRWVEKTPLHIHCLPRILEWFPEGKFLLIIRDGRDVACSIRDRTGSLTGGVERWVEDNLAGRPFWEHPNVHCLRYERLVSDFDGTLGRVAEFLGESFEENMRHHNRKQILFYSKVVKKPPSAFGKHHRQYRDWQINQPLFDGRGRWKSLSHSELDRVLDRAGFLLRELGYIEG